MLKLFFSFQGRLSRPQFWRAYWRLLAVTGAAALPGMMLLTSAWTASNGLLPRIMFWAGFAMVAAAIVASCVAMVALSVKRAHDLGQPGWYRIKPSRLMFADGESHDNRYGPAIRPQTMVIEGNGKTTATTGWRTVRWLAGLGLVAIAVLGLVAYRMIVGPSWKWLDCRPTVTGEGPTKENARERWLQAVAATHGPAYAESGITLMIVTACNGAGCRVSARPCVRAE